MPIIDEEVLQAFRDRHRCEWCLKKTAVEPHHVTSRGFGGGMRFDVTLNLVALCRECHNAVHSSRITRNEIVFLASKREGLTPEQWWDEIYKMRREDRR